MDADGKLCDDRDAFAFFSLMEHLLQDDFFAATSMDLLTE